MTYNETLNAITLNSYKKVYNSCTLYIVLFAVFLITSAVISTVFIYFYWHSKKLNVNENSQTGQYKKSSPLLS